MTNSEKLIELIRQNPELPVVPMVDSDVVGDDCGTWMGEWGEAEITDYYLGKEKVHFKGWDDEEDVLNDMAGCKYGYTEDGVDIYELSDEEWNKLFNSLPWIKAIVVRIEAYRG